MVSFFLKSLSREHVLSGIGEMLHYFVFSKKDLFYVLKKIDLALLGRKKIINQFIVRSLKIKKKIIEKDEFDLNERNLFNFGHTFGHAFESYFKFKIPHGKCVALGIDVANYISLKLGMLKKKERNILREVIVRIIPEIKKIKKIKTKKFIQYLKNDKKSETGYHNIILMRKFGNIFKYKQKDNEEFKKTLEEYFEKKKYLKNTV